MHAPNERYIDLSYLRRQTKSNPVLLIEMIDIYLEQTPALVDAMKTGLAQNNPQILEGAAHKIKPSFLIMGVRGNQEMKAKEIQEMAINREPAHLIGELVSDLEKVCKKVCEELKEELAALKNDRPV